MSASVDATRATTVAPPPQAADAGDDKTAKVVQAMIGVMSRCKEIPKLGWNKEGKYEFVNRADLLAKVQDALVAERLVISQIELEREFKGTIVINKYTYHARHGDGGCIFDVMRNSGSSRIEFKSGTFDDKSIQKAQGSAWKYAVLTLFCIPTDDAAVERMVDVVDNDTQGLNERRPPEDEARRGREAPRDERRSAADRGDNPPDDRWGDAPAKANGSAERDDAVPSLRQRVSAMMAKIFDAMDEEEASGIWRGNARLIDSLADTTYDWCRDEYQKRWQVWPPALSNADADS
jgi:hypothetical protein